MICSKMILSSSHACWSYHNNIKYNKSKNKVSNNCNQRIELTSFVNVINRSIEISFTIISLFSAINCYQIYCHQCHVFVDARIPFVVGTIGGTARKATTTITAAIIIASSKTTTTTNTPIPVPTTEYIAGQRCRILRRHPLSFTEQQKTQQTSITSSSSIKSQLSLPVDSTSTIEETVVQVAQVPPPLFICIGMAQTIELWEYHLIPLSQNYIRDVIIYEPLGLGLGYNNNDTTSTYMDNNTKNVSIPRQAECFINTIKEIITTNILQENTNNTRSNTNNSTKMNTQVDIVGYSLGGRIALGVACLEPKLIRSLHITGVGLYRTDTSYIQLYSWEQHLVYGNIQSFALAAIVSTYSSTFVKQNIHKLPFWINTICTSHTATGLLSLLQQTSDSDLNINNNNNSNENDTSNINNNLTVNQWSVQQMVYRIQQYQQQNNNKYCFPIKIIIGQNDTLVPIEQATDLTKSLSLVVLNNNTSTYFITSTLPTCTCTIIENCGHSVPMELPRIWRQSIIQFHSTILSLSQ